MTLSDDIDFKTHLRDLAKSSLVQFQDELIRNMDRTHLTKEHALNQLEVIGKLEVLLDVLLTQNQEIGGFGSYYTKKCLEQLGVLKMALQMEIDDD